MRPIHVPLAGGYFARVDEMDYLRIVGKNWQVANGYARRHLAGSGPTRTYRLMHHEILGVKPMTGLVVDHINRDRLDNRRSNLRIVSHRKNHLNLDPTDHQRGVSHYPRCTNKPWRARLGQKTIGYYATYNEAVKARQNMEDVVQ